MDFMSVEQRSSERNEQVSDRDGIKHGQGYEDQRRIKEMAGEAVTIQEARGP